MPKKTWKHLRGRSSYSPVSFNTFVSEEKYTARMLKEDLEEAGIRVTGIGVDDMDLSSEEFEDVYRRISEPKSYEFSCVFEDKPFTVGIDERWQSAEGSRIIFEADLLQLRYLMIALGVNEDECTY
jgi:hypothetical protein